MKKFHLAGAALALSAMFALPPSAAAASWTTTDTGVVTAGSDTLGSFGRGGGGCCGAELTGLAFTAVVVTDSSTSGATIVPGPDGLAVSGAGAANPVSAALTINGHTLVLGGSSGSQQLSDNGALQGAAHSASNFEESIFFLPFGEDGELGKFGYTLVEGLTLQASGLGDGDFNSLPPGMVGVGFLFQSLDTYNGFVGSGTSGGADLLISSVEMTVQEVPEPGTWALMILGFGAAGAALRRRSVLRPA
jgi:hypothetical protein